MDKNYTQRRAVMKESKVNRNMLLNMAKTILSVIFPLITYPYATRTLGPDNFGKVSFGLSIIGYISLISALGISNYAIREGGIFRRNRREIDRFASEIFTINIISTFFAYLILFALIAFSSKIRQYSAILAIQSVSILFTLIGTDWINAIFEDYLYITVRSLAIQVISLLLLFAFVKTSDDYLKYAGIAVMGNAIVSALNFFYVRKYCRVGIAKPNFRKHIKPIAVLFSNNIAVSIYCNSDITMVGLFYDDFQVGLYSLASKIYSILKQVIAAAYSVSVTRMSEYKATNQNHKFEALLNDIINTIILIAIPVIIGGCLYSDFIIFILAGEEFIGAGTSFQILIFTVLPAVFGGALAYCVNLPLKREMINLKCTTISAVENIILNAILIPSMGIMGAAVATLASETSVFMLLLISLKHEIEIFDLHRILVNVIKCLLSCIPLIAVHFFYSRLSQNFVTMFIVAVIISAFLYIGINIALKNHNLEKFLSGLRH